MFTGIVHGLGRVIAVEDREKFRAIRIDAGDCAPSSVIGASVAISGVCLTVTKVEGSVLSFDVMQETLVKTTTGSLRVGDMVCVEPSMKAGDEIGGHFVLGHVDGVGEVVARIQEGENTRVTFRAPEALTRYIVEKGSIAIDGVSLTVCDPCGKEFDVWLLPLTLERTTLGTKQSGDRVNIEVDYLLKAVLYNRYYGSVVI